MGNISDIVDRPDLFFRLFRISEQSMSGGFCVTKFPERDLYWSPGLFDLLEIDRGISPSEELFNRMIHPDDRRSTGEIEASIANALPYDREFRLITGHNAVKRIANRNEFVIDSDGKAKFLISSMTDITRRHQASLLLDVQRHRFNALTSSIASLVSVSWTARSDGYVERQDGWERLTGQPPEHSEGWGWLDRIHPEDRDSVREQWHSSVWNNREYQCECRIATRDGSWMWIAAHAQPIRDVTQTVIEWVGVATTIQSQRIWVVDPDDSVNITGAQLRAARGLLNWSVATLSAEAGVSCSAIRRLEDHNGVTRNTGDTLRRLKDVLQIAGVDFIFPPNGKSGVRPR